MIYISTLSFLFILITSSNFFTLKFNIKNNQSYLISCCAIILIAFSSYFIDREYNFNTLNYLFFLLIFFSIYFFLYLIKNISKIQKGINFEFIFIFLIIFYFSKDRYYLDQDEFRYWGVSLKELLFGLQPYNQFNHHPKATTLFQYLLVFFDYKEGLAIFANNILLISAFFYLFYERKLSIFEKIILFSMYYLLLNNLSFGFLSIYSDPVLAIFFSCILKLIYFFITKDNSNENQKFFISFSLIFLTLLLINRASNIYALFILFIIFILFFYKNKNNFLVILKSFLVILFLFICLYFFLPKFILRDNFESKTLILNIIDFVTYQFTSNNFFELFTSPIYFSHFGVLINGILSFFSLNNILPQFQIPLYVYIVLLFLILPFNFKYKFFFVFFSFFSIFIYSIIVFILKFQIGNLSILSLQRYVGILVLSNFFFYISLLNIKFNKVYKNYILFFFILFLICVTPKKTLGFFASEHVYYSSQSNKNFKINRNSISKLNEIKNEDNIFFIHKDKMSDYSNSTIASEHTFYYDIILYELYPKKIKIIEYQEFIQIFEFYNQAKENKNFFIFFDLSVDQIKKVNFIKNSFFINTY
jgi:hypothetical protein